MRRIISLCLVLLFSTLGFAAFSSSPNFEVAGNELQFTNYDYIYNQVYLWNGVEWQSRTCVGPQLGNGWLSSCTLDISAERAGLPPGTYSLAGYACNQVGNSFNCNGGNWLLTTFTVDSPQTVASRFAQEPATYTVGSGVNLDFNLGPQDADVNEIVFQVWHNQEGRVTGAYLDADAPFSYPSLVLDTLSPGTVNVQAILRANNAQKSKVTFDMSVVGGATGPICGNGIQESGESCDDANVVSGDGCSSTCQEELANPVCGNSVRESGETCDDGNTQNGDGCSSTCQVEVVAGDNQCNDGIDNDGDGLVDYIGTATKGPDLGCYGPGDNTEQSLSPAQEDGWYTWNKHSSGKIIYVSDSQGNDNNDGLSPQRPVKTLRHAETLWRYGEPDWILLKAGDTWDRQTFTTKSWGSRYDEYPQIVGVYGSGPRPKIESNPKESGFRLDEDNARNIVLQGIHFPGTYRNPYSPKFEDNPGDQSAIRAVVAGDGTKYIRNILYQDNKIEFANNGIRFEDQNVRQGETEQKSQVTIHRNIIAYSSSTGTHANAAYIDSTKGSRFTGNTIYHSGWLEDPDNTFYRQNKNWRDSNVYMQDNNKPIYVSQNLIFEAGAAGIQQRAGGDNICNVYAENAISLYIGKDPGTVSHNIITETNDISPNEDSDQTNFRRGWGLQVYGNADFQNNYGLYMRGTAYGRSYFIETSRTSKIENNYVYDWRYDKDGIVSHGKEDPKKEWTGVTVLQNYDKTLAKFAGTLGISQNNDALYQTAINRPRGTWPKYSDAREYYKYFSGGNECPPLSFD